MIDRNINILYTDSFGQGEILSRNSPNPYTWKQSKNNVIISNNCYLFWAKVNIVKQIKTWYITSLNGYIHIYNKGSNNTWFGITSSQPSDHKLCIWSEQKKKWNREVILNGKSTKWNVRIFIQEYYGKQVINGMYSEEKSHKVSTKNIVQFLLQI